MRDFQIAEQNSSSRSVMTQTTEGWSEESKNFSCKQLKVIFQTLFSKIDGRIEQQTNSRDIIEGQLRQGAIYPIKTRAFNRQNRASIILNYLIPLAYYRYNNIKSSYFVEADYDKLYNDPMYGFITSNNTGTILNIFSDIIEKNNITDIFTALHSAHFDLFNILHNSERPVICFVAQQEAYSRFIRTLEQKIHTIAEGVRALSWKNLASITTENRSNINILPTELKHMVLNGLQEGKTGVENYKVREIDDDPYWLVRDIFGRSIKRSEEYETTLNRQSAVGRKEINELITQFTGKYRADLKHILQDLNETNLDKPWITCATTTQLS